ncbi:Chitobiosyldiphosphodolichol beta-mannosyltransferase [Mycena venus]|uniref:Chitobiosyldiphosphodolichol beta-mannosyltransferase n=1 Tax=Mycena venus TaxID=2733690 RepID=A0A8H6XFI7_9AGAR|nr:Chitobiosyldiphosphodolichol beta-mannosyltransferase [Mycena venus]
MFTVHDYQAAIPRIVASTVALWLTWKIWSFFRPRSQHSLRSVAIVVLGDIGRSPRMMYHAESFLENDFFTDIIGYGGSTLIPSLSRARIRYIPEPPRWLRSFPFIVSGPIKVVLQVIYIFIELFTIPNPPEFILVQNPPSIPTLAIVWIVGRIRGCKVIIDWHNLGFTILAMRFPKQGERHPLVRLAQWFERTFGRTAYAHLFVTEAMRDVLVSEWDLQGHKVVLHDRPPRRFHQSTPQEIHDLFAAKLQNTLSAEPSLKGFLPKSDPPYSSVFTATNASPSDPAVMRDTPPPPTSVIDPIYSEVKAPFLREDRPALLVSSTSWTQDEDFSILITALGQYNARAAEASNGKKMPKLLVILTGKGPLRDKYMAEVGNLQKKWDWVFYSFSFNLVRMTGAVYSTGSADLGISLHASSSNLDLPMKVVDMFGCALPVCALDFSCLNELVKHEKNGLVFKDAAQLAQQIESLLTGFPDCPRLTQLRSNLLPASDRSISPPSRPPSREISDDVWETWDENWARYVRPLILQDVRRNGI